MLNNLLLNIILFCHFLVVCFVVGVPFFGNNYLLIMHAICVPFMMLHWIMNDNTCALSVIEVALRKKLGMEIKEEDCFTCQLVNPIYDFKANNETWSNAIYLITSTLAIISIYRIYVAYSNGEITSFMDLVEENNKGLFNLKLFYGK